MKQYSVKWLINGELTVKSDTAEAAEAIAQERIVETVKGIEAFKKLGPLAIQGNAEPLEEKQ
jgi:hypothetical protein